MSSLATLPAHELLEMLKTASAALRHLILTILYGQGIPV